MIGSADIDGLVFEAGVEGTTDGSLATSSGTTSGTHELLELDRPAAMRGLSRSESDEIFFPRFDFGEIGSSSVD